MALDTGNLAEQILDDLSAAIAVRTASDCGLLDQLARGGAMRSDLRLPTAQGDVLVSLLLRAGLVDWCADTLRPTADFETLLSDRRSEFLARLDFDLIAALDMLEKAARTVPANGAVGIVERGKITPGGLRGNMPAAANLVFACFFRDPNLYWSILTDLGHRVEPSKTVQLDVPIHILLGRGDA